MRSFDDLLAEAAGVDRYPPTAVATEGCGLLCAQPTESRGLPGHAASGGRGWSGRPWPKPP